MPGDRDKSRQRKVRHIEEVWGASADRAWMKWKRCELCGERICVNNWADRKSRTPRLFKRVICPWCEGRRGRRRMTEHIIFEALAKAPCLLKAFPEKNCKCLACKARRIKDKWDTEDKLR